MRKALLIVFSLLICVQLLGCSKWLVRTSSSRQARVDQEVAGNRGFISGKPSSPPKEPTFKDRKVYKIEVEIPPLMQKKKAEPAAQAPKEDQEAWGNKGYLMGSPEEVSTQEKTAAQEAQPSAISQIKEKISQVLKMGEPAPGKTYMVRKGDTLQKISRKFYGTTKKWPLLYKANKDKLKSPDKVYPGQTLIIPEAGQYKK